MKRFFRLIKCYRTQHLHAGGKLLIGDLVFQHRWPDAQQNAGIKVGV